MKKTQKMIIISLLVLALLPGLFGIGSAAFPMKFTGGIYRNDSKASSPATVDNITGASVRLWILMAGQYTLATPANSLLIGSNPVTTGSDGFYSFANISIAKTYRINVTYPAGFIQYKFALNPDGNRTYTITASSGDQPQDFFAYKIPNVIISGGSYLDNTPGTSKGTGFNGATIELQKMVSGVYTTANNANSGITGSNPITTGSDGQFSFGTINQPGTYQLNQTLPAGYQAFSPGAGIKTYIISADSTDLSDENFFNYQLPKVVISGHKYSDPTGDHTSTLTPLKDWTINLLELQAGSYVPVQTATTDANGFYQFNPITAADTYQVAEVAQDGYTQTFPHSDIIKIITPGQTDPISVDFWNQPTTVPIPEFPTVAVSILTISGMVIAVQFLKKRN